jgi:hypothetical protein
MEYLLTYAWAILIIAVVLIALFGLGLFNTNGGRIQPGTCNIYRPYGPGTTIGINTQGPCNGGLPVYVAAFGGSANISIDKAVISNSLRQFSISLWVNPTTLSQQGQMIGEDSPSNCGATGIFCIEYNNGVVYFKPAGGSGINTASFNSLVLPGQWYNVVATYSSSGNSVIYLDGVQAASGALSFSGNGLLDIGSGDGNGDFFIGQLSNIQVYNISLSSNGVASLYAEGMGGVPIDLDNIVAWWPLNGDTKDYSGNAYDGRGTSVLFPNNWQATFSTPK